MRYDSDVTYTPSEVCNSAEYKDALHYNMDIGWTAPQKKTVRWCSTDSAARIT
jgi:hypothetical protein